MNTKLFSFTTFGSRPFSSPVIITLFVLVCQIACAVQANRPAPGVPRVNQTQFETQGALFVIDSC